MVLASSFETRSIKGNYMKSIKGVVCGALLAVAANAWAFPSDPCAVATATCRTITNFGTSSLTGSLLAARATFELSDTLGFAGLDTLTITLSNVSPSDIQANPDILTALLFTLRASDSTLIAGMTPVSALIDAGSDAVNNAGALLTQPTGDNVGGEWEYRDAPADLSGTTFKGFETGISSSGLQGWFGSPNFNGVNLSGPPAVDGQQYGLVGPGTIFGANPTWNPDDPMVKDTVKFKLTFDSGGKSFDLTKSGALSAGFQYGTGQNEPLLPVPGTVWLLALGAFMLPIASRLASRRTAA
jgi:hypothetical protein